MAADRLSASALIEASPERVYAIIADYHDGHPRILPRPPFVSLAVEEGGRGAGTVIRVGMRVLGRVQTFQASVSEPEPGRVLVETNDTGDVTTFTVLPRDDGRQAHVTIATDMSARTGPVGALERWLMARLLPPVFARELELLAEVAKERAAGGVAKGRVAGERQPGAAAPYRTS